MDRETRKKLDEYITREPPVESEDEYNARVTKEKKSKKDRKFIKLLKLKAKEISDRFNIPLFSVKMIKYALFAFWYNKKTVKVSGCWWFEIWLENFLKTDLDGKEVLIKQIMYKNIRLPEKILPEALKKQKWVFQQRLEEVHAIINLLNYDPSAAKFEDLPLDNYDNSEIFDNFLRIIKARPKKAKRFDTFKGYFKKGGNKKS